ncbi:uncharacterized protein il11a [Esox lucius]|uniref:Uncharacterized protein n=1 Tax=Esox lucius TaxID=8010 RepID=A0A3P9A851_ESOLU|nr:uncharacterized protein il11a [Esox lucius]
MKLLVDSSFSLLLSLLLTQLPLFTSAVPAPYRRLHDLDKLTNQTKNLRQMAADLLKEHAFETDLEHHRFKSLPVMNNRASDINSLEMKPTLSQLHNELKSFEHHFAWLSRASKKHHHPLPKLVEMITLIKTLITTLERQMSRVDAERLPNPVPVPSLPPHLPSQWDVLQSSQELLQQFRLFCDWAQRVFSVLSTKSKTQ